MKKFKLNFDLEEDLTYVTFGEIKILSEVIKLEAGLKDIRTTFIKGDETKEYISNFPDYLEYKSFKGLAEILETMYYEEFIGENEAKELLKAFRDYYDKWEETKDLLGMCEVSTHCYEEKIESYEEGNEDQIDALDNYYENHGEEEFSNLLDLEFEESNCDLGACENIAVFTGTFKGMCELEKIAKRADFSRINQLEINHDNTISFYMEGEEHSYVTFVYEGEFLEEVFWYIENNEFPPLSFDSPRLTAKEYQSLMRSEGLSPLKLEKEDNLCILL